jgi:nucleoside-diphosphate-sugar epimerase
MRSKAGSRGLRRWREPDMSDTILITGATGFLGARAVAAARAKGLRVRATARRGAALSAAFGGDAGVEIVALDLACADEAALAGLLSGVSVVIHCAAAMAGDDAAHDAATVAPTRALARAMAAARAETGAGGRPRLVLISSFSVYGYDAIPAGACLDETLPTEPDPHLRDAYCRAKLAQEAAAIAAAQQGGLEVCILRPGAIYGPGRTGTARLGIAKKGILLMIGGGAAVPAVHVDRCAEAAVLAATVPLHGGATSVWPGDLPMPDGAGRVEICNLVDDAPPSQAEWAAALIAGGALRRAITIPGGLAAKLVKLAALSEIVSPRVPALLPGLVQAPNFASRFKGLRHSNARAVDRLGWRPGIDFRADMARAMAGEYLSFPTEDRL